MYNALGSGHKESVYQKALVLELEKKKLKFSEQKSLEIFYDGKKVGNYKPDFIIEDKVIIEIKATEFTITNYEQQLKYYLKGTNYALGLLVNFGASPFLIRRVIWTAPQPTSV